MKKTNSNCYLLYIIAFVLFTFCKANKDLLFTNKQKNAYHNYYISISKADSLFMSKKYEDSYAILDSLFKHVQPINTFRTCEYYTFMKLKKKLGKKYLKSDVEKLISKYGLTALNLKYNPDLDSMRKSVGIDSLGYNKLRKHYLNSLDLDLRKKIKIMLEEDQRVRYNSTDIDKREWKRVDSINEIEMTTLFDKNIYPNNAVIGNFFVDREISTIDFEVMLLHTADSIRVNYFLPKIKKFIYEGKCSPYVYGQLIDQLHLYNKKPQVYGTYDIQAIDKSKYKEYNEKRYSIGLPSIQQGRIILLSSIF